MTSFDLDLSKYQLGWSDDAVEYAFAPEKGINDRVVDQISWWKGEPRWMTNMRLRSLKLFDRKPMAEWFAVNMPDIDFQDIYYYLRPSGEQVDDWDDLPEQMKATYEKLGIPEAERKYLAGVTAQYESEVVYHRNREDLAKQGILFCDMDTALREYPDLVKQYFGTVIPPGDNKFAALNTSVWSGGSFIYVPPGVECEMPLQAYFRINAENAGQFERTLIIADEGSQVHYIEGCSAPVYTSDSLHSAVVEIVVKPSARVTYTTIQNWSPNVYNLVTKRARVEAEGHMEWIDGNIGSKLTMKYPSVYLVGPKATGEVLSVAYAGAGQHQDAGAKMIHAAPETTSKIVSKSISKDGGKTTYRGLVRVDEGAHGCKSHVQCDALILDDDSESWTLPYMEVGERDAQIGHEATVSKVADEQLFYLMSPRPLRGAGDGHGRQRLHRADHPHAADGVRRRVEPADRAADGGLGRLTGAQAGRRRRHTRRAGLEAGDRHVEAALEVRRVERLAPDQLAEHDRSDDRPDDDARVELGRELAACLGPLDDVEDRALALLRHAIDEQLDLAVARRGLDERRHEVADRSREVGHHHAVEVGVEVAAQRPGVRRRHGAEARPHGVQHERAALGPVAVDRRLGDARAVGDLLDGEVATRRARRSGRSPPPVPCAWPLHFSGVPSVTVGCCASPGRRCSDHYVSVAKRGRTSSSSGEPPASLQRVGQDAT